MSLVLVLLFSFLMTTLEAARIRGATAYLSMLSELAGDSFLATYYYPLFQNYRLFGVDAGEEEGYFSEEGMEEMLKDNITFGTDGLSGGLLRFQSTGVTGLEYKTILSDGGTEFLRQIRQQTVLDGFSLALRELFSEEQFTEAGVVGEIYREQEEALAVTATVTAELLNLMELVDGIRMGEQGIAFAEDGKMQANESFIKQLLPLEQAEIKAGYDNTEVFRAISGGFFQADRAAGRIESLIVQAQSLGNSIAWAEHMIFGYQVQIKELKEEYQAEKERLEKEKEPDETELLKLEKRLEEVKLLLQAEENAKRGYEISRSTALYEAKTQYRELKEKLEAVQSLLKEALKVVERLEKKQWAAKLAVEAYEIFLDGMQPKLSEELYQVFLEELDKMRIYAGLEERGFSLELIEQSLQSNQTLLEELSLSGFSEGKLFTVLEEMASVKRRMASYTVDGLWFSYGEIVVAKETRKNVTGFLSELLTTGVLSLVGVSEEEQSDRSLSGEDLPSAGLEKEGLLEELMACIDEVRALFQTGGIGEVLLAAGNAALDETALELYSMRYFHSYGEDTPYTRLNYEREYLIFGHEEDKSNLLSMVLYLVAIRALLSMVMILKQPDRMVQLEALSTGVAGFTGIPVLAAVVKYSVLLLWSVEEALVEVSALLQGKRIPVVGVGTVSFEELFFINKAVIERKSQRIPDGIGASYQDYLALVSLTKGTKEKVYRAMDLIQENIRFRYNDSFRMRNVVTELSFHTKAKLKPLFDTGIFPAAVYELENRKEKAY